MISNLCDKRARQIHALQYCSIFQGNAIFVRKYINGYRIYKYMMEITDRNVFLLYFFYLFRLFTVCIYLLLLEVVLYLINQMRGPHWEDVSLWSTVWQYGPSTVWSIKKWPRADFLLLWFPARLVNKRFTTRLKMFGKNAMRHVLTSNGKQNRTEEGVGRKSKGICYAKACSLRNMSPKTTRKSSRIIMQDQWGQCPVLDWKWKILTGWF